MRRTTAIGFALQVMMMVCAGCGTMGESPSQVIVAAYTAANERRYEDADRHLSAKLLEDMNDDLYAPYGGKKGLWDQATRGGGIKQVETLSEVIQGSRATVLFRLHFVDGRVEDEEAQLIREGGRWKMHEE